MNIRVCGPNLRDQSRGTFHVHRSDCNDLNYYGPGRKYGGDELGTREMLIKDATVMKVVRATYADQIAEQDRDHDEYAEELANDFWFAPCCSTHLSHDGSEGEEVHTVWECWTSQHNLTRDNFVKLEEPTAVQEWLLERMIDHLTNEHIHIVAHDSDEYQN